MAAVKEAYEVGINFFDTSPYYGDTKSEAVRVWGSLEGRRRRCLLAVAGRGGGAPPLAPCCWRLHLAPGLSRQHASSPF